MMSADGRADAEPRAVPPLSARGEAAICERLDVLIELVRGSARTALDLAREQDADECSRRGVGDCVGDGDPALRCQPGQRGTWIPQVTVRTWVPQVKVTNFAWPDVQRGQGHSEGDEFRRDHEDSSLGGGGDAATSSPGAATVEGTSDESFSRSSAFGSRPVEDVPTRSPGRGPVEIVGSLQLRDCKAFVRGRIAGGSPPS